MSQNVPCLCTNLAAFRPSALRQEERRGRGRHSRQPWRRQDHCGGGHRECPPSSTDQLNISWQKLKDFCWGGPNIVPRPEWIKSGLLFHPPEQTNAYGLNASKGATKAFQIVLGMFLVRRRSLESLPPSSFFHSDHYCRGLHSEASPV